MPYFWPHFSLYWLTSVASSRSHVSHVYPPSASSFSSWLSSILTLNTLPVLKDDSSELWTSLIACSARTHISTEMTSCSCQLQSLKPHLQPVRPAPPTLHWRQEIARRVMRVINNRLSSKWPRPLVVLMRSLDYPTALCIKRWSVQVLRFLPSPQCNGE